MHWYLNFPFSHLWMKVLIRAIFLQLLWRKLFVPLAWGCKGCIFSFCGFLLLSVNTTNLENSSASATPFSNIRCFSPELNATLNSLLSFSISRNGRRCWIAMLLLVFPSSPCDHYQALPTLDLFTHSLEHHSNFIEFSSFSYFRLRFLLQSSWLVSGAGDSWSPTGPSTLKGPALGLMFSCCHLEVLNVFWTRVLDFHFALGPSNHVS